MFSDANYRRRRDSPSCRLWQQKSEWNWKAVFSTLMSPASASGCEVWKWYHQNQAKELWKRFCWLMCTSGTRGVGILSALVGNFSHLLFHLFFFPFSLVKMGTSMRSRLAVAAVILIIWCPAILLFGKFFIIFLSNWKGTFIIRSLTLGVWNIFSYGSHTNWLLTL